jgi:hypothetical protein
MVAKHHCGVVYWCTGPLKEFRMARDDTAPQSGVEQQLVTELATLVLEQTVPEGFAILDGTSQECFVDLLATLNSGRRDEQLGFGLDVGLLGPYDLVVATLVVTYLDSLLVEGVHEAAIPLVADLVQWLFRRPGFGAAPIAASTLPEVAPTSQQGRSVRDTTYERAWAVGLSHAHAGVLADAVVGRLVNRS